jgi:hypothetical protein
MQFNWKYHWQRMRQDPAFWQTVLICCAALIVTLSLELIK